MSFCQGGVLRVSCAGRTLCSGYNNDQGGGGDGWSKRQDAKLQASGRQSGGDKGPNFEGREAKL